MKIPYSGHVMFISPHPDDEVISSGFLLMNLIKYRNSVHIHHLTSGSDPEMMPVREQEATKVSKKIGARCFFHRLDPHGDMRRPAQELARLILEKAPDLVIMPSRSDPHPTHRFSHEVVSRAISLSLYHGDILQYSIWEPIQHPDYFVLFDDATFEMKRSLLEFYGSQLKAHDLVSWVTGLDRYHGVLHRELSGERWSGGGREILSIVAGDPGLGPDLPFAEGFRRYPGLRDQAVLCIGDVFLDILPGTIEKNINEGSTSTSISHSLGGNAGNAAMELARLGRSSALYTAMGEDWRADMLEGMLRDAGVRPFIIRKEGGNTAMTLAMAYHDGSRHFISDFSTNLLFTEHDLPILQTSNLKRFNHCHRAGFFWIPGLRNGPNLRLLRRVREVGMSTSLDVGSPITEHGGSGVWGNEDREEIMDLLPFVDIFFGNESEILGVAGLSTQDRAADAVGTGLGEVETDEDHCQTDLKGPVSDSVVDAARTLVEMGAGMVVVHQGDRGATIVTEGEVLEHRAPDVSVENPTGAGDVFNAAFIDAYLMKLPSPECLAFAVAAGSLHVSSISNPYPTREEVITFMGSILIIDH